MFECREITLTIVQHQFWIQYTVLPKDYYFIGEGLYPMSKFFSELFQEVETQPHLNESLKEELKEKMNNSLYKSMLSSRHRLPAYKQRKVSTGESNEVQDLQMSLVQKMEKCDRNLNYCTDKPSEGRKKKMLQSPFKPKFSFVSISYICVFLISRKLLTSSTQIRLLF